jgi:acyl carrier protein
LAESNRKSAEQQAGEVSMYNAATTAEIRSKIKQIVANITNVPQDAIADDASFVEDLQLDSLSLLEIGVDVDYEFKLSVPEERLQKLRTIEDVVQLVETRLSELMPQREVA